MKKRSIEDKLIFKSICETMVHAYKSLPSDVIDFFTRCYEKAEITDEKNILSIILKNIKKAENEKLSLCQDTGSSIFYIKKGTIEIKGERNLTQIINDAVSFVYSNNNLRPSIINDPLFGKNTGDNTPAIIHIEETQDNELEILFMAKGGGSENTGNISMMNPADGIEGIKKFVIDRIKEKGANACPPLIVGIGIGGTMDTCASISKKALFRTIGQRNSNNEYAKYEEEIKNEINKLGIGAMGLGGAYTAMDVFIETLPRHIATMPVAVSLLCHSARRGKITL